MISRGRRSCVYCALSLPKRTSACARRERAVRLAGCARGPDSAELLCTPEVPGHKSVVVRSGYAGPHGLNASGGCQPGDSGRARLKAPDSPFRLDEEPQC